MKQASDDLHRIIANMKPEEKRLFKLSISENKKQTQAAALFDLLNEMPVFDPELYTVRIKRKKLADNAPSVKSQLKEKLILWLADQMNGPSGTGWLKQIAVGEVLLRFHLREEALHRFELLRKQACDQGHGVYELIALTYLSNIYQTVEQESTMDRYIQLSSRVAELTHKLHATAEAQNYYMRTVALFYETRTANKDVHRKLTEQLRREHLFDTIDSFIRMEESIYIFSARTYINLMLGQLEKAYTENNKLYQNVIRFENRIRNYHPNEFALVMREKIYFCALTGKREEYEKIYQTIYQKTLTLTKNNSNYILRFEAVNLLYFIRTGQYELLRDCILTLKQYTLSADYELETISNKKEAHMYTGYAYMSLQKWDSALAEFDCLIKMKATQVNVDFDHTARFMILLCQFAEIISNPNLSIELPSFFLNNQADAFYEYLVKKRIDAPIEKKVIKTLKEFSNGGLKRTQRERLATMVSKIQSEFENLPPYYLMQLAEYNWINDLKKLIETNILTLKK